MTPAPGTFLTSVFGVHLFCLTDDRVLVLGSPVRFRFVCVAFWGQCNVLSFNDTGVSLGHRWCLSILRDSAAAGWWRMSTGAMPAGRRDALLPGLLLLDLGSADVSQSARVSWDPS